MNMDAVSVWAVLAMIMGSVNQSKSSSPSSGVMVVGVGGCACPFYVISAGSFQLPSPLQPLG